MSAYGAVPINGNARTDAGMGKEVPKFGAGKKTGEGRNLQFVKLEPGMYGVAFDNAPVGYITRDSRRSRETQWVINITTLHYLASEEFPLAASSARGAMELLAQHW
jgi:hypothetical protein